MRKTISLFSVVLLSYCVLSTPCYSADSIYLWEENIFASTTPEEISHGDTYSRRVIEIVFIGGTPVIVAEGIVEMFVSDEEQLLELKYKVTDDSMIFCPRELLYLVQNEAQVTLAECTVEYIPSGWGGCDEIVAGVAVHVKIRGFPDWFDFWSTFTVYFGVWLNNDHVDVLEMENPPTTTTTTTIPTTSSTSSIVLTTTSSMAPTTTTSPCATEQIYGTHSEQTELLRIIRDNILSQTPEGREIIRLYYEWSPAIIKAMKADPQLKEEIKEMVNEVIEYAP